MGISYIPVLGVGVKQDDITYESLTDYGKSLIRDEYLGSEDYTELENEYCGEDGEWIQSPDDLINNALPDWFSDNLYDRDLFYALDLNCNTGNYMTGWYGMRGVKVSLNDVEKVKEQVDAATEKFSKVCKLTPEVFHGVLVC